MDTKTMTLQNLCGMFDHTQLKAFADRKAFEKLCREAAQNHFAMVAVNSAQVKICKELLAGTNVHTGAAISFPLGQTPLEVKVFETETAIKDGADEIDYVINIGEVKNKNYAYIEKEMKTIVAVCRKNNVVSKVIFENCYLEKDEIRKIAQIAKKVKPDFIKTSTGFGPSGADAKDVKLMKETVGDDVKVKAAGGIRSWETCKAMIEAGAERIGTSSSLKIIEEFLQKNK